MKVIRFVPTFAAWRQQSRPPLRERVAPQEIVWQPEDQPQTSLFGNDVPAASAPVKAQSTVTLPRAFLSLAEAAACHADPARWDLLYRVAFRLSGGEPRLLEDAADPSVHQLRRMASAVERDVHKMQAFVRFRRVAAADGGEHFVAFHRPEHHVVERVAPFFVDRFQGMRWTILTPVGSASWDMQTLQLGPGVPASAAPGDDELDDLWRTYYAAVFNPARLNLPAMRRELPRRHWDTLPEARLIQPLALEAQARTASMSDRSVTRSARDFFPPDPERATLTQLAQAAAGCQGCPLYAPATATVFGEGPPDAPIMLVGEQPGDEEDRRGHAFVGPAGQVLDEALSAAGLDRRLLYLTNTVKHFKFEERGKWRIHQRPRGREVEACKPWVLAEIARVRPRVLVALGATAAGALFGRTVTPGRSRGRPVPSPLAPACFVTYHPSAVLRAGDADASDGIRAALIADLRRAAAAAALDGDADPLPPAI